MDLDQGTIIRSVCETVILSGFDPIWVVTGFENEKIDKELSDLDVFIVHNADWEKGMATSINTGISVLPEEIDGNLIVLGDMPFVSTTVLDSLRDIFDSNSGTSIVFPVYNNRQGNPVIFPKKYFPNIKSSTGDRGCKKLLKQYPGNAIGVPVDSNEVLLDCDTPDDYEALMEKFQGDHVSA